MSTKIRKPQPPFLQKQGKVQASSNVDPYTKPMKTADYKLPPGNNARASFATPTGSQPFKRDSSNPPSNARPSRSMHEIRQEQEQASDPLTPDDFAKGGFRFQNRVDPSHLKPHQPGKQGSTRRQASANQQYIHQAREIDPQGEAYDGAEDDGEMDMAGLPQYQVDSAHPTAMPYVPAHLREEGRGYETDVTDYRGRAKRAPPGPLPSARVPQRVTDAPGKARSTYPQASGVSNEPCSHYDEIENAFHVGRSGKENLACHDGPAFHKPGTGYEGGEYDSELEARAMQSTHQGRRREFAHNGPQRGQPGFQQQQDPLPQAPPRDPRSKSAAPLQHRAPGNGGRPSESAASGALQSVQQLMEERTRMAQESTNWRQRCLRAEELCKQSADKAEVTENEMKALIAKNEGLESELKEAIESRHKLAVKTTRRCAEADCLIEVKDQQIERLKDFRADFIEQLVTMKETMKKVDTDGREADKAIAAGRDAVEAAKSIKKVYDQTEVELRAAKEEVQIAQSTMYVRILQLRVFTDDISSEEVKKADESRVQVVWESLDHVMDVRDRELLRLSKSDPVKEIAGLVKDKHDRLSEAQSSCDDLQAKLATHQAQQESLRGTISSLAATFDIELAGYQQDHLSAFAKQVSDAIEKKDRVQKVAADQMKKLLEANNDLQHKLNNAAGSTLAEAQKENYERNIGRLQAELDTAKSKASHVPTLEHEVIRLKTELESYKEKGELARQELTRAKVKAIEEKNVNIELQKERQSEQARHAEEVKLAKAELDRLQKTVEAMQEENKGLKAIRPNGIGVGASAIHAEEKRKLEATITGLKAQLAEKAKPELGIVERWTNGESTEDDKVLIKALDANIEAAVEAKHQPKLRALRDENVQIKKRMQKLNERIASYEKLAHNRADDDEEFDSTEPFKSRHTNGNKLEGPFLPATTALKQQARKRGLDAGGNAAPPASQKKAKFADLNTSSDPIAADMYTTKSSSLSPVDDDESDDDPPPAPPSTQNRPIAKAKLQKDESLDLEEIDDEFGEALLALPMFKNAKAARVTNESDEDEYVPTASQAKAKPSASQAAKRNRTAGAKNQTAKKKVAQK